MKRKLMILAAGVMVTLAACNKENGVNSAKVPVQQTKAVSYNAVIADRAANPQNPYDSIGMIHNEVLQTVVAYQQKTGDTTVAMTHKIVAAFFQIRYSVDVSNQFVKAEQNFTTDFPGWKVNSMPDGKIEPLTAAYINKILTAIHGVKDSTDYGSFKQSVVGVESAAINDKSLGSEEQQKILIVASVARYSLSFWLAQTNVGDGKNDVMGFFHNVWKAIGCGLVDTGCAIDGIIHLERPRVILEDASDASSICSAFWDF